MKKWLYGISLGALVLLFLLTGRQPTAPIQLPPISPSAPAAKAVALNVEHSAASTPLALAAPVTKPASAQPAATPIKQAPEPIQLFNTSASTAITWSSKSPAALRARTVQPDYHYFTAQPTLQTGDLLELPLFDDVTLQATIKTISVYPNGAVGLTAYLTAPASGTLFLTYSGVAIRMHAQIANANDYHIRYDALHGQHIAIEENPTLSQKQADAPSPSLQQTLLAQQTATETLSSTSTLATPRSSNSDAQLQSTAITIDVMIVYTPAAQSAEGGLSGINNNIAQIMQKANEVHSQSGTGVTLNLVHSAAVSYTESGDPGEDLTQLTYEGGTNSAMDEVHTWRNTYSADMVCLLESEPGTGGLGWTPTESYHLIPSTAFCLARVEQSDWTYTVVHEWGHNMGCGHSKSQTHQAGPGYASYSAGWQWNDAISSAEMGYCSVMTYEDIDADGTDEYTRLGYFSNPSISYNGNATGNASDGDNARTIIENAPTIAAYFTATSDDAYEPNDTPATAYTGLSANTWLSTISGSGIQSNDDWYAIPLTNANNLQIQVQCTFTHSQGDIDLKLYDSANTQLVTSVTTTDNESINYTVDSPGTYYLLVTYGNAGNAYDLWWNALSSRSLSSIAISGPSTLNENESALYTCTASYSDGSSTDVSATANWSENSPYATMSSNRLNALSISANQNISLSAEYEGATNTLAVSLINTSGPDLAPYLPPNWDNKIVISTISGTNTSSTTFTTNDTLYVDFASLNAGDTDAGEHYIRLYVDDQLKVNGYASGGLASGYYLSWQDQTVGPFSEGSHTFKLVVDATDLIAETDETNNEYTRTITVVAPGLSFANWATAQNIPSGQDGYFDSPAGDGIENIWKFATGLNALTPYSRDALYTITPNASAQTVALTYLKSTQTPSVLLTPSWKSNLVNGTWLTNGLSTTLLGTTNEQQTWRATLPLSTNGFIRLLLELE